MNQHLQNILNFLNLDKYLSDEEKNALIKSLDSANKELERTAFKLDQTEKLNLTTSILLGETIEELEQKQKEVIAKNRKLEIEASLEKVRSRTSEMQKSEELGDVAEILFKQIQELGIHAWSAGFNIWQEGNESYIDWITSPTGGFVDPYTVDLTTHSFFREISDAKKSGTDFQVFEISGEPLAETYKLLMSFGPKQFEGFKASGFSFPTHQFNHYVFGTQVGLMFITPEPHPEDWDIFKRFGQVFEQTYTRFLDLQKAEKSAREGEIELALERVRARTMGMQHSSQLREIAATTLEQLQSLGFIYGTCSIVIMNAVTGNMTWWISGFGNDYPTCYENYYFEHPFYLEQLNNWKEGKKYAVMVCEGEAKKMYDKHIFSETEFVKIPVELQKIMRSFEKITFSNAYMRHGALSWSTEPLSDDGAMILQRFASVFEQSYTRFLDLQKAEALAREAQIELGLERVRAKAMSMQQSHELAGLVETVFKELTKLNLLFDRCIIMIYDQQTNDSTWWLANPERESDPVGAFVKYHEYVPYKEYLNAWKSQVKQWNYLLEGKEKKEWDTYIFSETNLSFLPQSVINGMQSVERVYLNASFNNFGSLTVSSLEQLSDSNFDILLRFAKVFDLTYTRFNDLQKSEAQAERAERDLILLKAEKKRTEEALNELQITQKQLIQAEKMASLGELTAGIAHEIQNPLNFVNNFSEVSTELVDEMNEEILQGNLADAQKIAADLKENISKINHHGKRAGDIVRGMLQHSRTSSGQKELTDINELADEYLRLAYHGLRARDKTFNATMKTDFDESIGKIHIIPQDIGRVILNLITNAFYVVDEKKKSGIEHYQPTVSVITKKIDGKILIRVKDNGNGIPSKVLDKIFQPFFTTKPTGQGTGLGLSLSYDIVKAHGGEINVNTKVNEGLPIEDSGTEFTIQLPI